MDFRSALSILFFAGGVMFFALAGVNFWGGTGQVEHIPLDEVTSTPNATVNLQHLTEQPLTADSTLDLPSLDVLSLVVLPANYGCGLCSRHAATYADTFDGHPAFEDLSTQVSEMIVEPDVRTATHFARVHRLGVPAFQRPEVPSSIQDTTRGTCFAVLVDPQTETAFFKVHLDGGTAESDAVFEAAREAYRQRTPKLASQ